MNNYYFVCRAVCAVLLLYLFAPAYSYAQETETVAVLNILSHSTDDYVKKNIKRSELEYLTLILRNLTSNTLRGAPFLIMDANNMESILKKYNKTLDCVDNTSCAVDIGQYLEAAYVVVGFIQRFGNNLKLSINMYDSSNMQNINNVIISVRINKNWQANMEKELNRETPRFFDVLRGLAGLPLLYPALPPASAYKGPQVEAGEITSATSMFSIITKPKKSVRITITDPYGKSVITASPYKNAQARPGKWRVKAEAKGFISEEQNFNVLPDEAKTVKIMLNRFPSLVIAGMPKGAKVVVKGPNNFSHIGGLPWKANGLLPGVYEVEVSREGYTIEQRRVELKAGIDKRVEFEMQKWIPKKGGVCTPILADNYHISNNTWGACISGEYAYVTVEKSGLQIIDISNPARPRLKGRYDTPGLAVSVYVSGSYAYVTDEKRGLQIIDISNPARPRLKGTYDTPGLAWGIDVLGNYAYIADWDRGLQIIDISNPARPRLKGTYDTPGQAKGVYISGSYAYVADRKGGLQIIDISNPARPRLKGTYTKSNFVPDVYVPDVYVPDVYVSDVYVSGNYAYITSSVSKRKRGLQIIDISNPANPSLKGSYISSAPAVGVYVSGNCAYIASYKSGLQIIDISNPARPRLKGRYDTPGLAVSVYVSGNYAYVADIKGGLQIIDISSCQ